MKIRVKTIEIIYDINNPNSIARNPVTARPITK